MARFTQYPAASTGDYADATTFLIANSDGDIKQASLEGLRDNFGSSIQSASLVIASVDVLQLNTTPQTIVAAQGAGKAIEVISASVKVDFNTTAYSTYNAVELICNGADVAQYSNDVLGATLTRTALINKPAYPTDVQTVLIANADLKIQAQGGDPTTGDSDIEVFVLYRVIDI